VDVSARGGRHWRGGAPLVVWLSERERERERDMEIGEGFVWRVTSQKTSVPLILKSDHFI
jgi:hypothetical protein